MTPLTALLVRDMRIAIRVGGGALMGVLFFLVVVTLTPFAIGPDLVLLKRIGPAILWLAALLASLLALDRLFASDHEDGSLDLILMGHAPLELVVAVKGLAHWLTTGLPLIIAAPLIGLLLNIDGPADGALALTLLAGTPALTLHWPDRRRHRRDAAARRLVARHHCAAADGPRPDLWRRRGERGSCRPGAVRHAIHDSLRAVAGKPRRRPVCRRRRIAAGNGIANLPMSHAKLKHDRRHRALCGRGEVN
jgi:hypothetical protein